MEFTPYHINRWNGLISSELSNQDLEPEKLAVLGETIVNKPNRMVRRIDLEGTTVYAKWFVPTKSFLKRLFRKPLAFRLLETHKALLSAGIGCAEPLLAAICDEPTQILPQLFVYKEVPYPNISQRLKNASTDEATRIYDTAAEAIATLHKAGFVHGDCLPGNICLSDDNHAFFIDNDRTSRSFPFIRKRQERRNLVQFCAHAALQHDMSREMQRRFLAHYFECHSQRMTTFDHLLDRIEVRRQEIQRQESNAAQRK